jgi:hypothetical protein
VQWRWFRIGLSEWNTKCILPAVEVHRGGAVRFSHRDGAPRGRYGLVRGLIH